MCFTFRLLSKKFTLDKEIQYGCHFHDYTRLQLLDPVILISSKQMVQKNQFLKFYFLNILFCWMGLFLIFGRCKTFLCLTCLIFSWLFSIYGKKASRCITVWTSGQAHSSRVQCSSGQMDLPWCLLLSPYFLCCWWYISTSYRDIQQPFCSSSWFFQSPVTRIHVLCLYIQILGSTHILSGASACWRRTSWADGLEVYFQSCLVTLVPLSVDYMLL